MSISEQQYCYFFLLIVNSITFAAFLIIYNYDLPLFREEKKESADFFTENWNAY